MANGAFKFKDNSGNVVAYISGSGSDILISGGTLNLSGMTGLTLGNLTMSGTTQNAVSTSHAASYLLTSSFNSYTGTTNTIIGSLQTSTGSLNTFTSSTDGRLNNIETITGSLNSYTTSTNTRLGVIESTTSSLNTYTSSNNTRLGVIEGTTSSLNTFTSSANGRLNSIEGKTGSYATTGSNTFNGNLTVTGYIDTLELRTTYISSSILYRSGSTKFGDELTDTHAFTGSMLINGTASIGSPTLPTSGGNILTTYGSGSATAIQVNTTTNHATFFEASTYTGSIVTRLQSQTLPFVGTLTNHTFDVVAGGTVVIHATGSGLVGINKSTTPNTTLDVNGNTLITGSLTTTGTIYTGTNLYWSSDGGGDIGQSSGNRPNNIRLAGALAVNATLGSNGTITALSDIISTGGILNIKGTGNNIFSGSINIANGSTTNTLNINQPGSSTTAFHLGHFSDGTYISNNYYYAGGHQYTDNTKGSSNILLDTAGISLRASGANTTPANVMFISGSGQVGLGTITPFNKFTLRTGTGNNLDFFDTGASFGVAMQAVNDVNTVYKTWDFYASKFSFLNGTVQFGSTAGYTTATQGQFFSKGGGGMFTANLLSGGWGRHFTMQRNDVTKFHIGVDGNDNFAIMNSSDSYLMTVSAASEITSIDGEMYFKRSAFSHYGHVYMGSNSHFYIRNSGAYNMYLQTNNVNQITLQNDGTTVISSLRTSTLYTEFSKNLSGAYSSGTYYKICDSSELTTSGIYMITAYVDTYAIGGGIYFCTFASVPFYWFAGGSNSVSTQTLPTMLGTGHHNLNPPIVRIRLSTVASGDAGKQFLEFDPNANWSNVQGTGGATVTFYVKRIGS